MLYGKEQRVNVGKKLITPQPVIVVGWRGQPLCVRASSTTAVGSL